MEQPRAYEQYPARIVLASNLLSIAIYLTGAAILYKIGLTWAVLYIAFILLLELRLVKGHCVDCWYYGKTCAFGKGRLSCLLFPKGNPERFNQRRITKKDLVPDLLVLIIPVVAGLVLLAVDFSWDLLVLVVALFILGSAGNAFVRGTLACHYCRQREIGCPAQKLFEKR